MSFRKATIVAAGAACLLGIGFAQPALAAPAPTSVAAPAAASTSATVLRAPTVHIPSYTSGSTVHVTGTANPGAKLDVFAASYPSILSPTITASADGTWSLDIVGGNLMTITVFENAGTGVTLTGTASTSAGVSVSDAPFAISPVLQGEVSATPAISGVGTPGATINILDGRSGNSPIATTTVEASGRWVASVRTPLPAGQLAGTVQQVAGSTIQTTTLQVVVR